NLVYLRHTDTISTPRNHDEICGNRETGRLCTPYLWMVKKIRLTAVYAPHRSQKEHEQLCTPNTVLEVL
ncbi:31843_t:CDS:1, partial [Racocetra persica]